MPPTNQQSYNAQQPPASGFSAMPSQSQQPTQQAQSMAPPANSPQAGSPLANQRPSGPIPAQSLPQNPQAAQQPLQNQQQDQGDKNQKSQNQNPNTSQHSLLFSELREGMVIMADGSFRAVVECQSINFDLMSSREREGVEYSYQNFLNSLSFDAQIYISSRRVDIAPYIDSLAELRRSQDNMLLGVMMDDYINFIDQLAQESNIMDKRFYIVISFVPNPDAAKIVEKGKGFFGRFFVQNAKIITKIDQATYQKAKDELQNRVQTVISGLFQVGVHSRQLNTRELGELYYSVYNPDTAVNQPLGDYNDTTSIYVKKASPEARNGAA